MPFKVVTLKMLGKKESFHYFIIITIFIYHHYIKITLIRCYIIATLSSHMLKWKERRNSGK